MAQCGLLVLFGSEVQSRWSLRSRCQKHQTGWAENRRLIFWSCELLNGETEAVNPHPLKHKVWQLTRVQSFSDAWLLGLWLFHPVSFGEDLMHSILKRQAELAQIVYGVLWAQDKQWEQGEPLQKWRFREEPHLLVPKTCEMEAMVCWSVNSSQWCLS